MNLFFSPGASPAGIKPRIEEKARRLTAAFAGGNRFFLLPAATTEANVEWILASFLSPITVVPISPLLPPEAKSRLARQLPDSWVEEKDLPASGSPARPKGEEEIWAVVFSSGSSGEAKGVALSGRALRASAQSHGAHLGSSHWLLNLPLYHVGGFSVLSRAHFLGTDVSVASARFDAAETARWIAGGKVRGLSLVPTTLARLLQEPGDFSSLRTVLLGGAPAEPRLAAAALHRGLPIRLTYGMTEHSSQIATETHAGSGLLPLPGVRLQIAEDGEILVRSDCLASGFFRGGKLEPLPLREEFFPTGDLGRMDSGILVLQGRKSEMIISGGVKIFPQEIEPWLDLPGLVDAAVTSVPDPEWGEKVCAAIVGNISPDTVKSHLAGKIDPRKMPKVWVKVDRIPRSPMGKVMRAELRRLIQEKPDWA